MSATKKKLVYKQDPDGVFRLKKLGDDDKLSTKSDKRTVDDYLNDLISCAYQVVDPNKKVEVESVKSGGSEQAVDVHMTDGIEDFDHPNGGQKLRVNTQTIQSPTPNQSPVKEVVRSRSPIKQSPNEQFSKEPSPGLNIAVSPTNTTATTTLPRVPFQKLSVGNLMFHIPSFGFGLIIAIIISQTSTYIAYYGKIAFNYAKIGLVWAIILGAIGWYSGLIKIQDISALKLLTSRFIPHHQQQQPTSPVVGIDNPEIPSIPDAPEHEVSYDDYEEYQEYERQDRRRPRMRSKAKAMDARERELRDRDHHRERDHRESRKNTVTNVVPFKPQSRTEYKNERSNSVPNVPLAERNPPKLNRFHSTEPKSNYSKFVERTKKLHKPANSLDSFDSNALRYSNNQNHNLNQVEFPPVGKTTLPSLPDEDLPFVNEVKLIHGDEVGELPGFGVHRLNTTNSKRSVLGTRANYNKFLENAHYE